MINWKIRFQNGAFLIAFIGGAVSFVYTVLGLFDIVPSITQNNATDMVAAAVQILVMLGIVTDPTTSGVTDSDQALSYTTPKED